MNYYESYQQNYSQMFEKIKMILLEKGGCKASETGEAAFAILRSIREQETSLIKEKLNQTLSIKPTKSSRKTIEYIQNYLLGEMSSPWIAYLRC